MSKVNFNKERSGVSRWLACLAGCFVLLSSCRHTAPGTEQNAQAGSIPIPGNGMTTTDQIQLNEQQIRLGNIRVDTIRTGSTGDQMVFTGILNFNQEKLSSVNTRVDGRIEKLYIKRTGELVHKGDPLYELYSEPLNNAKQEYANALQQQKTIGNALINYGAVVESAKGKLILWGLTERQISGLGDAKESSTTTTFYSQETGYVTALNVQEGGYAMEGAPVLQLADLSTLWAEAQVFTTQLSSLDMNSHVIIRIPDLDNELIPGTIDFVNPEIDPDTRINLVRATVRNTGNRLHPGMPVYIIANNNEHHGISLPNEAVLTDSKGSVVWVQVKPGIYAVRDVQTGNSGENSIEIKKGLRPGDIVVTSGAYLINSEYIFEHGSNPMEGMTMGQN